MVLDASTALSWCFPDESNDYADSVLDELEGKSIVAPEIRSVEVANGIAMRERRKRLKPEDVEEFLTLLAGLALIVDRQIGVSGIGVLLSLTRQHGLTAYGASYLAAAMRHRARLPHRIQSFLNRQTGTKPPSAR